MELRQLECFVRTAELGSFTKAAALLHISQPALSKSIRQLEEQLGVQLFDRNGKKVSLNKTGADVLAHGQVILRECQAVAALCGAVRESDRNSITLRMTAASEHLPGLLSGFRQIQPDISIVSLQAADEMDRDEADILVYASRQAKASALDQTVLREPLALAVPKGHPLYQEEEVALSVLKEHGLLSLRPGNDMRMLEDYYFGLAGVSPHREVECDTPSTLRALVRDGFGIALVPTVSWQAVHSPGIKLIPIAGIDCVRYINISVPQMKRFNQNTATLYRFMEEHLEEIIRSRDTLY